jgi:predicted small secreted protein
VFTGIHPPGNRAGSRAFSRQDMMTNERTRTMRLRIFSVLLLIAAVPLASCATVKGAGKDLQSASDSVNDGIHGR